MSRPDEGLIHTWLDGECTPDDAARIERLIATDPDWAAAVAEARGLVAASSRIVQALDAVPTAMPAGSRAAPVVVRQRAFRVRPWMQVAAGLVLVAGTAYVLREEPMPFEPSAQEDRSAPAPSVTAPAGAESVSVATSSVATIQPPTDLPVGETRTLGRVVPAPTAGAPAPFAVAPAPVAPPPRTALARSSEEAKMTARQEEERRATLRSRMTSEPARGAVASPPMADALAGAIAEKALPTLAGCWRVSAPPELVGVLREPEIVRQSGDTLVLRTTRGDLTVTRTSDRLRGGLDATLEVCPTGW